MAMLAGGRKEKKPKAETEKMKISTNIFDDDDDDRSREPHSAVPTLGSDSLIDNQLKKPTL